MQDAVALRTPLLVLTDFGLKPLVEALIVEDVPTSRDSFDLLTWAEGVEADDAVTSLKLIQIRAESHTLDGIEEVFHRLVPDLLQLPLKLILLLTVAFILLPSVLSIVGGASSLFDPSR